MEGTDCCGPFYHRGSDSDSDVESMDVEARQRSRSRSPRGSRDVSLSSEGARAGLRTAGNKRRTRKAKPMMANEVAAKNFMSSLGVAAELPGSHQKPVDASKLAEEFESAFRSKNVVQAEESARQMIKAGVRYKLQPDLMRKCYQDENENNDHLIHLLFMTSGFGVLQDHTIDDFLPKYSLESFFQKYSYDEIKGDRKFFGNHGRWYTRFFNEWDDYGYLYIIQNYVLGTDNKIHPFTSFMSKFSQAELFLKHPQGVYEFYKDQIADSDFLDVLKNDLVEYLCIATIMKKFVEKQLLNKQYVTTFMWPSSLSDLTHKSR